MAESASHRRLCAAPGCGLRIPRGWLMCRTHWRRLPIALAAEVNDAWSALRGAADVAGGLARVARYRAARDAAVAHFRGDG